MIDPPVPVPASRDFDCCNNFSPPVDRLDYATTHASAIALVTLLLLGVLPAPGLRRGIAPAQHCDHLH
jgi:hypothetical protein